MFNYFNMGFDSLTAYKFHTQRQMKPHLFPSSFINKCWYVLYALDSVLHGSPSIKESCRIWIDNEEISIPHGVRTIVVLNFLCYQAGINIWGNDKNPPNVDDKVVEVVGIEGLFHEVFIRVHLASGIRLGRGKKIQIHVMKPNTLFALAWDGEPSLQKEFVCEIAHFQQIEILFKNE